MRKRVKRFIAVGLCAVAVTAATQGPAAADHDNNWAAALNAEQYNCYNGNAAGGALFYDHGEKFYVEDYCPDRSRVRVRWKITNRHGNWRRDWNIIHHTAGPGDGRVLYDQNLPEGRRIKFQVGLERSKHDFVSGSYGQVADHVAGVLFRHNDFNKHNRL